MVQPARLGFGSRLIQHSIAKDLGGEVRMEYLPQGLKGRLSFPLMEQQA